MQKIIITMGITACGKSTWAKQFVKDNPDYVRFCRDDARAMLNGGDPWIHFKMNNKEHFNSIENAVTKMRDSAIVDALAQGKSVVLDETNANSRTFKEVCKMLKKHDFSVIVEEKPFYIDYNTALNRDRNRTPAVGDDVMAQMWQKFGGEKFQFYKPKYQEFFVLPTLENDYKKMDRPPAIICDLDGCLALFGDANPYNRDFTKDIPNLPVLKMLYRYAETHQIIFVSGRLKDYQEQTLKWLFNIGLQGFHLFMREFDDSRNDARVKWEIYRDNIHGKWNVDFVLDDRNRVVNMWRKQGLTCLQVAEGDF